MAIALLTHTKWAVASGATSAGINTAGATLLVVTVACSAGGTPTVSDSSGGANTFTALTAWSSTVPLRTFYCFNPSFTNASHTFTIGGLNADDGAVVACFSGTLGSGDPFDTQNGTAASLNTGSATQTGSITPAGVGELLIIGFSATDSPASPISVSSINNSFSVIEALAGVKSTNCSCEIWYLIDGASSAINPAVTPSASSTWGISISAFKPGAGGNVPVEDDAFGAQMMQLSLRARDEPMITVYM